MRAVLRSVAGRTLREFARPLPYRPPIAPVAMRRPPLPVLLLLPLLAILLFGNCGGGVNSFLGYGPNNRNARLANIINRREIDREAARRTLHGRARRDAYRLIEQTTESRLDSLYPYHDRGKMDTRRHKTERRLRQWYPRPRPSGPIEVPRVPAP